MLSFGVNSEVAVVAAWQSHYNNEVMERKLLRERRRQLYCGLEDYDLGTSLLPTADHTFACVSPLEVVIYCFPPPEERDVYRCRA